MYRVVSDPMLSVKEAAYIHCRMKNRIFKSEKITRLSYMHSRRLLLAQIMV